MSPFATSHLIRFAIALGIASIITLFPGDVSATKLWDVALAGDSGFLIVVSVACVAAFFLWRKGTALASRLWLLLGAVLGASFVYNLVEAVRVA